MNRIVILVLPSLLLLPATATLGASQCDRTSITVASHLLARASQSSIDHVANVENCRACFKQFVEAVTARQAVATWQDGVARQRALETLDVEIQLFNDRIAEQSCGQ